MLEHLILNGRLEAAYQYHQVSPRNFKEQLMAHFNKGKRKQFMKLYILLRTEEKLQFYLRVYFLIYNIHPALKPKGTIPEEQIVAFRQFLDTKGADLAKTNQFLQFYALSYVKKPLEHPSYKSLFKKEWVTNLTDKLTIFLQDEERRMRQVAKGEGQSKIRSAEVPSVQAANNRALQQKNKRLFEEVEVFKAKYTQLEQNNQALIESFNSHLMQSQHKWFQITRELTNNARTLVDLIAKSNSGLIHDRRYQRIKRRTQKFQKIVRKQLDQLLNQSQDLSVFDKPSANEISYSAASVTPNLSQRNLTTFVALDQFVPTNYLSLIKDFRRMADPVKATVLRGFSWRIIKSKNKWVRRQTIVGLVVNDVLGLVNGDIQLLLFNPNLTYYVLQLFLFVSEDCYGRKVLFRNGGLYKQVVDLIPQTVKSKNFICLDLVMEILLNIWHNRDIYRELIGLNIIDICINMLLQEPQVMTNDPLLESIATLILNATTIQEGLDSLQYQVDVFYYLCEAFKGANDSNRNLIGAIIFALLGRKNLWKLAHQANLPNFIDDLIKIDERSNKQQLKLIQGKLHSFQPGKIFSPDQYEDEESVDSDLQEQNFERNQDELQQLQQYIKGHEMLAGKYSLKQKQAEKQLQEINAIMKQNRKIVQPQQEIVKGRDQLKQTKTDREKKRLAHVHLPEIKKKKDTYIQATNSKIKSKEGQQYYSYKSPNFKQNVPATNQSAQADSFEIKQARTDKQKISGFISETEERRMDRIQTKPHQRAIDSGGKQQEKQRTDKRSAEKPEYRIKKSSSVQKGLGSAYRKQEINYQTNRNSSNVADYKSTEAVKSPLQKKSRQEVLKQLNQQLRAQKRAEVQQRKISAKNIPVNEKGQRENAIFKRNNNFVQVEEDRKAFESKPKLRRTPPKQEK